MPRGRYQRARLSVTLQGRRGQMPQDTRGPAHARGRHGGRPAVITADKLAAAQLMRQQKRPMQAIATALGVSRATLYRHLDLAATELEREPAA